MIQFYLLGFMVKLRETVVHFEALVRIEGRINLSDLKM